MPGSAPRREAALSAYEQQRNATIAENQRRLREDYGLTDSIVPKRTRRRAPQPTAPEDNGPDLQLDPEPVADACKNMVIILADQVPDYGEAEVKAKVKELQGEVLTRVTSRITHAVHDGTPSHEARYIAVNCAGRAIRCVPRLSPRSTALPHARATARQAPDLPAAAYVARRPVAAPTSAAARRRPVVPGARVQRQGACAQQAHEVDHGL